MATAQLATPSQAPTTSQLKGPFRLSVEGIDVAVNRNRPGVFALGSIDNFGRFSMSRIGRSDHDLHGELRQLIGSEVLFKFLHSRDAEAAFLEECRLFHKFQPPSNVIHPYRPANSRLTCPYCRGHR